MAKSRDIQNWSLFTLDQGPGGPVGAPSSTLHIARQLNDYARLGLSGRAYPMAAKLSDQAIATLDLATRARRLATTLTAAEDVARLLLYADELETQAADLDRRAKEDC